MTRRKLFSFAAVSALALSSAAYLRPSRNPYYNGPVSDNFDGLRFSMPGRNQDRPFTDFLRWQTQGGRAKWPDSFPSPHEGAKPPTRVTGLRVTHLGHASFLVQVAGQNLLLDPVFSERASPFSFVGPRRVNPPGVNFEDLPPVDAVLITHNHYDHLDLTTLERLRVRDNPRFLTPLGNDAILRKQHPDFRVETADWGGMFALEGDVHVHVEPAFHWSARWTNDRRMALWCAFVLQTPHGVIYHIGDTGYGDGSIFTRVKERFGSPRLALIPIGAYEPRWFMKEQHMNPEDAVKAFLACGAEQALGHHWGTFQLTNEAIEQPLHDHAAALAAGGVDPERFLAVRPGQVWEV